MLFLFCIKCFFINLVIIIIIPDVKQQCVKQMQYSLLHDSQTLVQLIKDYKKQHPDLAKSMSRAMTQAVCKIAAKKVLNKALQLCKENVGSLLKNIRLIDIKKMKVLVKEFTVLLLSLTILMHLTGW